MFDGLGTVFNVVEGLAIVGAAAIIGSFLYGLYLLAQFVF